MNKWIVLSAVSVGTFMATLNASIVNVSLPVIARDFGVSATDVEWVVISYLLATGVLLLTFGRLGDVLGYRTLYVSGFAVFVVAGTICGFSSGIWTLTGLRVLQGIGAAAVQAVGPAIVTSTFDPSERGKALGINAISVSVGLALGPTLGGIISEILTWRWIFFVNLPIGLAGIFWITRVLPRSERSDQTFDPTGAILAGGFLFSLLLAIVEGADWGWTSLPTLSLFVAAVVLFVVFVIVELRVEQPMLELRLFAIRAFSAGSFSLLASFIALLSALFLMPFFLQEGQGLTALQAGLLITPLSLTTLVIAPFSGALSDRIGTRVLPTVGLGFVALGIFSLTTMDADTNGWGVAVRLMLVGFGLGVFNSPNQSAIIGSVPRPRLGTASGIIAQMRITGQVLGVAASSAIISARLPHHVQELTGPLSDAAARSQALILSIHEAFYFSAAVAILGMAASFVRGPDRQRKPG